MKKIKCLVPWGKCSRPCMYYLCPSKAFTCSRVCLLLKQEPQACIKENLSAANFEVTCHIFTQPCLKYIHLHGSVLWPTRPVEVCTVEESLQYQYE